MEDLDFAEHVDSPFTVSLQEIKKKIGNKSTLRRILRIKGNLCVYNNNYNIGLFFPPYPPYNYKFFVAFLEGRKRVRCYRNILFIKYSSY